MRGFDAFVKRHALGIFFLLAYGFTWIFAPLVAISPVLAVPGQMMPAVAAWIVITLAEGRFGLIKLRRRLLNWRADPLWYAVALGLPLVLSLAAAIGGRLIGSSAPISMQPVNALAFIVIVMVAGQEIGWRGYALPKLLELYSPLASSVILGLLWGLWHLPAFSQPVAPQYGVPLAAYLIYTAALSVLLTVLYNHTRGSVVLATLLHAATHVFVFTNPDLGLEIRWWLIAAVYLAAAVVVVLLAGQDLKFDRTKRLRAMTDSSRG